MRTNPHDVKEVTSIGYKILPFGRIFFYALVCRNAASGRLPVCIFKERRICFFIFSGAFFRTGIPNSNVLIAFYGGEKKYEKIFLQHAGHVPYSGGLSADL